MSTKEALKIWSRRRNVSFPGCAREIPGNVYTSLPFQSPISLSFPFTDGLRPKRIGRRRGMDGVDSCDSPR